MADERGNPWDYDPGPTPGSGFAELFAATPNYRGLGKAVLGREAFRWHFGPMFYRGRLDGSARVLVVGQEGAQDESLAHRSFTGGTGARMQHLLDHIGIAHSYLFLNTFVYPIFGQYTADLHPLAQDPRSPIVAHRHAILNEVLAAGEMRLVIAVGRAAKDSVATWIRAHGGAADPDRLHQANPGSLPATLRFLGVLHPGGAGKGASVAAIKADFQRASDQIRVWTSADAGWLPSDPGAHRDLSQPFRYLAKAAPHADFPFGSCPRLGDGGTTSNRTDAQRSIRLFSAHGKYAASGERLRDGSSRLGTSEGYKDDPGDLPYEPPRTHPDRFDPGPPLALSQLLLGAVAGMGWPNFAALGATADPSFGVGAVYRGRFQALSVLIIADQTSEDDLFCGRALCGESGQRLQGFLLAAGLTTRYLILRSLPVEMLDLTAAKIRALVDDTKVKALMGDVVAKVRATNPGLAAILAIGPGARRLAPNLTPPGLPVVEMASLSEADGPASWQAALDHLKTLSFTKDIQGATFLLPATRSQIPRIDLPYGSQRWVGTSGDRGDRPDDLARSAPSPDYLKIFVPGWVMQLHPAALSATERAAAEQLRS